MRKQKEYLKVYSCDREIIQRLLGKILKGKSGDKFLIQICNCRHLCFIRTGTKIYTQHEYKDIKTGRFARVRK